MSLAPIDFGLGEWNQEIPGTFNPRTGKVEYPKPEVLWDRGRMASDIFFPVFKQPLKGGFKGGSDGPRDGSFGIDDTPLNRQVFPEAFGSRFGVATHDKPFSRYPAAGGSDGWPGLPADKLDYLHPSKDPLLNIPITPFGMRAGGLRKAGMLFANEGLFSA